MRMWAKVQKNPKLGGGGVKSLQAQVRISTTGFSHLNVIMLSSHDDHIMITSSFRYPVIIIEENQPFQTTLVPHAFLSCSNLDHMVTKVNCI